MAKYLDKKDLRDKYSYYQSMIDFYRNQLKSAKQGYYLAKAKALDNQINDLIGQRDELLTKQASIDSDRESFEAKISEYSNEKAKIAFLLSKQGQAIFDMLGKIPPVFHDKLMVAIFSAATDESVDLNAVLTEIFSQVRQ